MREILDITKALADENRLRILMALADRELCVCQIVELLGLAPSTVSKHMSILRQAGLVEARKRGRWMYYRLPDEHCPKEISQAIEWVRSSLARDKRIRADARQIKRVCRMDKEQLCEHYRKQ